MFVPMHRDTLRLRRRWPGILVSSKGLSAVIDAPVVLVMGLARWFSHDPRRTGRPWRLYG
jgi:hypothetical protein